MEDLPINADTVNKSIDILAESTKETRKELDRVGAKGMNKVAQLFWASPIGRKADLYIAERPYKMELELKKMQAKYNKIPAEYQVEPTSYIALKSTNELNYALEEEHLKEMFENLLISDMDSRKKSRVRPIYIEIIKQLSKDDAKFLQYFHKYKDFFCSISITLKRNNSEGYSTLDSYIIYNYKKINGITSYSTLKLDPIVIDTLLMHKLIEVDYQTYYTYENADKEYKTLFEAVKNRYAVDEGDALSYEKGLVRLTALGKSFIDICLS